MTTSKAHRWTFPARFRAGVYSWKSSRLACQRLREAVFEIKKVAKKEPVVAAEGAVRLIEKLWPALEHVDSSSGALGSSVNKTLDDLISLIINAPAEAKTRSKWLERLWQAMDNAGRQNAARQFVRQALRGRVRGYGDNSSPVGENG